MYILKLKIYIVTVQELTDVFYLEDTVRTVNATYIYQPSLVLPEG
jgi:hypothetical protein